MNRLCAEQTRGMFKRIEDYVKGFLLEKPHCGKASGLTIPALTYDKEKKNIL